MPDGTRPGSPVVGFLARRRVALGFLFGALVLWLAQPTPGSLALGATIALGGAALRLWAAGHLEKNREVTITGPYRLIRHPLYAGSAIMGLGLAIAAARPLVGGFVLAYLGTTLWATTRVEEAWLRAAFGRRYSDYAAGGSRGSVDPPTRRFSWARAIRTNREYRAITGLLVAVLLLAWKAFG